MNFKITARLFLFLLLSGSLGVSTMHSSAQISGGGAIKISGKVSDENTVGIAGVSITLKGTTQGTTTDASGLFSIDVPDKNAVLQFSSVNYDLKEVLIGNNTSLTVQLSQNENTKNLGEVVVVGYGTQRKVDLTGAVASVTRKDFVNKPFTSPDQILGGRVSGVNIANRSGDPGAPIDVRIRGVGNTGTNQPLWVIDGVPIVQTSNITVNTGPSTESNPLAGINTSDIESIDVLKDASASAIYGTRAANGVIIVTTRRGKEGRTSLTYDGFYGTQSIPKNRQFDLLNVAEYIALQSELGRNFFAFSSKPFVDWQDLIFQKGPVHSHILTISGGSQKSNFSIGGGYLDNTGVELGQSFKRLSLKVNSDLSVGKYLKFGESLIISSVNRLTQSESGLFAAFGGAQNAPYYQP